MKKLLLTGVAGVALLAGAPAHAADLGPRPTYKAPPIVAPPVPIFTWTGCYLGIEGGGTWGRSRAVAVTSTDPEDVGLPLTNDFNISGGLFGGTIGCNYQFAPNWVIGIENDLSWTNKRGSASVIPPFNTAGVETHKERWLDTLRGRVGFSWDRVLIYGTGGVAFAGTNINVFNTEELVGVSDSKTRTGCTAGGGIEWAFWGNWTAKVEYLFVDFGSAHYVSPPVEIGDITFVTRDVKFNDNIVRVGINYLFNWGKAPIGKGPVVARY